jgi:hypothetical protein
MKTKIILFLIFLIGLYGCQSYTSNNNVIKTTHGDYNIVIIDSCEYIETGRGEDNMRYNYYVLTHKGNCKNH